MEKEVTVNQVTGNEKVKLWGRDFLTISLSSFFIFMTFYILGVTLPQYVLEQLHGSQQGMGLVTTMFIVAAVISRPLTGKWLDEVNRKKLVVFSLIFYAVCSFLYLVVPNYSILLILRFVHGFVYGVAATSTSAIVLDVIPEQRKGEGIGYFSLFMSMAMVFGPFVGLTLTANSNYTLMFIAVTVFSSLSMVCGVITRIPQGPPKSSESSAWDIHRYFEFKALPISLVGFVLAFAYAAIATFISVFAKSLGLDQLASIFFVVFAALILISRPFTGPTYDRKGPHVLVYPGLILFAVGMLWLSQANSAVIFLIAAGVIGLGYGAILPSFQTIAVQHSHPHRRGLATSTYYVLFDLGYGIGSYFLGVIASATSYRSMFFIGGLIVAFLIVLYYLLYHRNHPNREFSGE